MIAVDTNLLVYAHRSDSPFHAAARKRIETLRVQLGPWAIPWPCIHEFLGIGKHPQGFRKPTPLEVGLACVEGRLAGGNLHLLSEGGSYFEKLREMATAAKLKGPRIHEARIAALCLHHGVRELWSADRDFSAFPQLKVLNPLLGV
jgi:uncharacterized protein